MLVKLAQLSKTMTKRTYICFWSGCDNATMFFFNQPLGYHLQGGHITTNARAECFVGHLPIMTYSRKIAPINIVGVIEDIINRLR